MSDPRRNVALVDVEGLTEQERAVLAFENQTWRSRDAKAQAIATAFGWSETRHYQYVNALIDLPGATVEFPMLVKRLRRLRDTRRQARSA